MNFAEEFINTIFNTNPGKEITAIFKDGSRANYTADILNLLKGDPFVELVFDPETCEIL